MAALDDDRTWTTPDAARASGTSYRRLDYWSRLGILKASHGEARGSGSSRRWSTTDVFIAAVLGHLSDGRPLEQLGNVVAVLRAADAGAWDGWLVLEPDGSARLVATLPLLRTMTASFTLVDLQRVYLDVARRVTPRDVGTGSRPEWIGS